MDDSWKNWTRENLDRQCAPVEIMDILRRNGFALSDIRAAMGDRFPDLNGASNGVDYETLAHVRITRLETSGARKIETDKLQLYALEHFLGERQCDDLVGLIGEHLRPSTLTLYDADRYFRTSSTCDLVNMKSPIVEAVDRKIAETLGVRLPYSEAIQAQKYEAGQQFKAHTDYFEPNTEEYRRYASQLGNRTWTFMVYLNTTPRGGGTAFPNIDRIFHPQKGAAIVWNNLHENGLPNPNTLHCGMPVEAGTKTIITKWFREKGSGPMFYD